MADSHALQQSADGDSRERQSDRTFGLIAGGSPYSVIAILDTLKTIKPEVSTIAFGQSLSTATLLLVSPATPVV